MTKTKHNSKRPFEPQVVLQLATERVYWDAIQSKGANEKESNIALGVLFSARKYILGSLYPDGPFAADANPHALTGHYTRQHFGEPEKLPTFNCPKCGQPMEDYGSTFIERGKWDGNSYEGEGEYATYLCVPCDIEVTIADHPELTECTCDMDDPETFSKCKYCNDDVDE